MTLVVERWRPQLVEWRPVLVKARPKSQLLKLELADRIEAHYAPKIRNGLGKATGVRAAVAQAISALPTIATTPKAVNPLARIAHQVATDAVQSKVSLNTDALSTTLRALGMDAWLTGLAVGTSAGGSLPGSAGLMVGSMDWSAWEPGSPGAAAQVIGGGLSDLLDSYGVTIKGITDTQLDGIATAIATGLANGDNLAAIVDAVTAIRDDPYRSMLIARTETNRAQTQAAVETYQNAGFTQWNLLTSPTACQLCEDIADAGPYTFGTPQPPIHPQCRCTAVPVITVGGETVATGTPTDELQAAFEEANPTLPPTRANTFEGGT